MELWTVEINYTMSYLCYAKDENRAVHLIIQRAKDYGNLSPVVTKTNKIAIEAIIISQFLVVI